MLARMATMATVTTSSTSVKPRARMNFSRSVRVDHGDATVRRVGRIHGEADIAAALQGVDALRFPVLAEDLHAVGREGECLPVHVEGALLDADGFERTAAESGAVVRHRAG